MIFVGAHIRDTRELFRTPLSGGVYRYIGPMFDTLEALQSTGWETLHVKRADTLEQLYREVATALGLDPVDAPSLVDLALALRTCDAPTALLWTSWHELAIEHPLDWARVMEVLAERTTKGAPFAVVIG